MVNHNFKILIVDDERSNLEVLNHILKPNHSLTATEPKYPCRMNREADFAAMHYNYSISVAKSGQAALIKVTNNKPDLILLDIIMPGMSGYDVLSALKSSEATRSIPVIIITGLDSVADEERGFFLGAVDYITKPFHSSLVKARVRTHLQIVEQMRTIERLGLIDALTNIPNRRSFENQIMTEWGRAIRKKAPISMLMIDVDKFKNFNDTYGHQQGDLVLKTVAKELISALKHPVELAARWGGEEFAIILPDTELEDALLLAETIRANVESAVIPCFSDVPPLNVTISVGAASAKPSIDSLVSDFIAQADMALYTAKDSGRNKVCTCHNLQEEP